MTTRVLSYDVNVVPQERYWDCGPASAQVVLNALGIIKSEDELIAMIGTTENGTDFVGLVENALDQLVPQANYTSVYMPNDPPSQAQKDQLWADLVRSIDAGYGVVMNFVAPPSNYPRGVDGSPNPSYGGGTVYHYVPCMGYNDVTRAVYIADPGFSPHGYWISFDQCATLIPPKGYAAAMPAVVAPPVVTPPPPPPAPTVPDAAVILSRATGISLDLATQILPTISAGLVLAQCNTVPRAAMALAQWGWESARFSTTVEFGKGVGKPYFPYCGRTYGQLTWQSNYAAFGAWCVEQGLMTDPNQFVNDPDSLGDIRWAGIGAAWYWTEERPINELVDAGDGATWTAGDVTYRGALDAVTAAINGGLNGLDGRRDLWNQALAQGDSLLTLINNTEGEDFMSALTADEQREMLELLRQQADYRRESRSPLAWPGQGPIDTCAGFAWSAEGWGHLLMVEKLAVEYGDTMSITNLYAVATNGPADKAEIAMKILEKCDPTAITRAGISMAAWTAAENTFNASQSS